MLIRARLREAVPDSIFELWLAALKPRALIGDTLVITAPDEIRTWLADRCGDLLQACAASVLGPQTQIEIAAPGAALDDRPCATALATTPTGDDDAELHPKFTFDQFVIGDCNRFAHAAALSVAELPGQAYNPLFLYGPPGMGKTHLLHAIGNYVRTHGGGLRVRSTTAERFTNAFVAAVQTKGTEDFKAHFRETDVLLIDDVQFLQRKVKTEEEFFHTFNALHETGSQLVLTCDRLPADMAALEERLLERFQAGLVAELAPPDFATRLAILRKRVQHDCIDLPDEAALHAIAHRITANARTLEGALIRVVAFHSLTGRSIDAALAEKVLAGLYPAPKVVGRREPPTIDRIQELVCAAFEVTREELLSATRTSRVAWPRQLAMYLARQHTGASLPAIGEHFGGRNHTTVLYACRKAAQRLAADPTAQARVQDLERRLMQPPDDRSS
ncbi:MAG: Chromosomal replication initiator protein DnaA [uncultured Solirubrobacteraceae bacterium]|uniref:Chromosomal replication initiator protein DnaA n=1 Tax=uncultured Solirubrobacteraceae bacterium TaxID=1162706 RepID=A0A6J4TT41_9ACTN|nr:MAG: Chromosomal replication initiator protein DnaA [uncultured Solirubrobacteraceae bacterium]